MKLSNHIARMYRFSFLREIGKVGIVAFIIVILIGLLANTFLPTSDDIIDKFEREERFLAIDALHVKNDDAFFHLFLKRIKRNGDVLVLGTSESGFMDSYNYWELLNADSAIDQKFSVLYGAGRSCERYIPSLLNHPENWRGQKVIIIINPVYWRQGLDRFSMEYHTRYMNDSEVRNARKHSKRKSDFDLLFGASETGFVKSQMDQTNQVIDKSIHSLYYDRLRKFIGWETEEINHLTVHPEYLEVQNRLEPKILDDLKLEIVPEFNCTQHFIDQGDYLMEPLTLDAEYRNTALDYFMDLCKQNDMDVTFVIGPYNKILAERNAQQEIIQQYEALEDQLRVKFSKHGFDYIDATDISEIPATFLDKQHHSKFGGYLLYERIKEYLHE